MAIKSVVLGSRASPTSNWTLCPITIHLRLTDCRAAKAMGLSRQATYRIQPDPPWPTDFARGVAALGEPQVRHLHRRLGRSVVRSARPHNRGTTASGCRAAVP
jgi:hypothetical protein